MTAAQLAAVAGLLADHSRAAICLALLDGRAWTVGELAGHAGIAPSTASEHVARLEGRGLVAAVQQGRHRYVRLAGHAAAELIEDLAEFAAPGPPDPLERGRSLRRRAPPRRWRGRAPAMTTSPGGSGYGSPTR